MKVFRCFITKNKFMRFSILIIAACIASLSCYCQTAKKYNNKDIHALHQMAEKWERFWNTHNIDSIATLLRDDVDYIDVIGYWMKGKSQTVQTLKKIHQGVKHKTSTWQTDSIAIKYVKPDLAIMYISWGKNGEVENDGTPRPPRHGIATWVIGKQNNNWLLLSVQSTNIILPTP
jgi:uncharacterized protein (TIGR02246 family)